MLNITPNFVSYTPGPDSLHHSYPLLGKMSVQAVLLLALIISASASAQLTNSIPPSGLINVLQYACGVPIGDGAVHTVSSAIPPSCFSGKNTLADLAAITINGKLPFSFLTDSGSLVGPQCTAGGTSNCFTSPSGVYKLTDAKVGALDIAWLALQAAELQGSSYIPQGQYVVGSSLPLPIMIPTAGEGTALLQGTPSHTTGDGPRLSEIIAGSDFGPGVPLMSAGDPAGSYANSLGRYNSGGNFSGDLDNIRLAPALVNQGFPPASYNWTGWAMDGMAWGARLRLQDIEIDAGTGFKHGMTVVGDHTLWDRLHIFGGYEGLYWPQESNSLRGDLQSVDLNVEGQAWASIAVGNASITLTAEGETYLAAPVSIYGEPGSCLPIMAGSAIHHLMTEYTNLSFIWDGNNQPGYGSNGVVYSDAQKCRSLNDTEIATWFGSFVGQNDSSFAAINNFSRRASIDVGYINNLRIVDIQPSGGGGMMPNFYAANLNASASLHGTTGSVGFINTPGVGYTTPAGIYLGGEIDTLISQAGTTPLMSSASVTGGRSMELNSTGRWRGYMQQLASRGSYTMTSVGDCVEQNVYQVTGCGYNAGIGMWQAVQGIVMQGGLSTNGSFAPVATSGTAIQANAGATIYGGGNLVLKANTGVGSISYLPGSGGTLGTYKWTATGGGCATEPSGTFTVGATGAITAASVTDGGQGSDCTFQPSVVMPTVAGLTGAAVTLAWPSAQLINAVYPGSGAMVGSAAGGNGNSAQGTRTLYVNLGSPVPLPQNVAYLDKLNANFKYGLTVPSIAGSGGTPLISAGSGAGLSTNVNISGYDLAGVVTVATGTSPVSLAVIAKITFANQHYTAPQTCNLTARNAAAASIAADIYTTSPSEQSWAIMGGSVALASNTTYAWGFVCE